jgi:predicted transcriptional regulator
MGSSVLISIKPEFADKIFSGLKQYKYRKVVFAFPQVSKAVVYASSPVQKVISEFQMDAVLAHGIQRLWQETKEYSGIMTSLCHMPR